MRILAKLAALAILAASLAAQSTQPAQTARDQSSADKPLPDHANAAPTSRPEYGLLTPIPEQGGLPPIFEKLYGLSHEELRHRAAVREYAQQIRLIRHQCFGPIKVEKIRRQGIDQIREFTDPAAFFPLIDELSSERDDVRLALLDHFATQNEEGQAALAWVAIHDKDAAIRNEALTRMATPVSQPVLFVLDSALRSSSPDVANAAAFLSNALHVIQTIPLLIFSQVNVSQNEQPSGDLAWIAIQTQHAFVAGLQPVAGDNAGGFRPIIGIVSEGAVLRVMDAVVIEYRTIAHTSLVNLTTADWGQSTESMGYDVRAWWDWYNNTYLPYKMKQQHAAESP